MRLGVRFEPEATQELFESATWYEAQRVGLGLTFLQAIDQAIEIIRIWPDAAPRTPELSDRLDVRRAPVAHFPYRVIYLKVPETVVILAIAHEARRPGYWLTRNTD